MTVIEYIHPNSKAFDSYKRQKFSLPSVLIHYISKNPFSADGLLKLQKTCKYFFAKNKIVVLNFTGITYRYLNPKVFECTYGKFLYFDDFKYWLADGLGVYYKSINEIIPNFFYRCNLNRLTLNYLNLTLNEIDFLLNGGKVKSLLFTDVCIRDDNGAIVSCDRILSKVPNITDIIYDCKNELFNFQTFINMNNLVFHSKFESFILYIYKLEADAADLQHLCYFVKNNSGNNDSYFAFGFEMDDAEIYRSTLQFAINKLLQTWNEKEDGEKPEIQIF